MIISKFVNKYLYVFYDKNGDIYEAYEGGLE